MNFEDAHQSWSNISTKKSYFEFITDENSETGWLRRHTFTETFVKLLPVEEHGSCKPGLFIIIASQVHHYFTSQVILFYKLKKEEEETQKYFGGKIQTLQREMKS